MDSQKTKEHVMGFESLSKTLCERMKFFKNSADEFYICDRLNDNIGFLSIYKDALFHYVEGILLCERIYTKNSVAFEDRDVPKMTQENKDLYENFLEFSKEVQESKIDNQEEIAAKIQEYSDKFQSTNIPREQIKLPYYKTQYGAKNKFLLQKLSDMPDESILALSEVISNYIMSFYRTMFLLGEKDYGIILRGVESKDYIDIVALIVKRQD